MIQPPTIEDRFSLELASLGRYEIRGRIGRGTMGIVYRGYDPVLAREIALKTVNLSPALGAQERKRFLQRFFQEARIAAKLLHPGIVVTHDAAMDDKTSVPFIAMELVTGGSLADRMEREESLSWEEASRLVILLSRALDYAHREGVVHRDMKPANVLLTPEGAPKIADFGIAKLQDAHITQTGDVIGTPYYMSPEQLEADDVDGRSDLFSLASLFYALVAGRPPFQGPDLAAITRQILHKNPEPLSEIVSSVPRDLDGVIGRALAKERADRYASGAELADDIDRVFRGVAPSRALALGEKTREVEKAAPLERETPRRRSPLRLLLLLVLLGGGGYLAFAHWKEAGEIVSENIERTRQRAELRAKTASRLEEAREDHARGRYDDALRGIEEAISLAREGGDGASEAEALLIRGLVRADRGEWSVARADLDASASVFGIYGSAEGKERATLELAHLERDLGAFDRAEAHYQELTGPDAALGKALLEFFRGDLESAERALESVRGGRGEARARAALYLGILVFSRGDRENAERLWSEAAGGMDAREVDLFRGYAALASGRVEESKTLFDASLEYFEERGRAGSVLSAREGLEGRTDGSPLRTVFLGEPRTKRTDERRKRLP
jgi:tetratricopeptide (TPR) repeat protein